MYRAYICSPLGGNVSANIENAKRYARYALECGMAPFIPHFYALILNDDDEEEKVEKVRPKKNVSERQAKSGSNKIVNLRRVTSSSMEVCLFKPNNYDTDSREIADTLLEGKSVLLNFEGIEIAVAQRIVDFISGVTHAIDGKLQKISRYIFIVTPRNVDLSGDFTESDLNDFAFSQGLDF